MIFLLLLAYKDQRSGALIRFFHHTHSFFLEAEINNKKTYNKIGFYLTCRIFTLSSHLCGTAQATCDQMYNCYVERTIYALKNRNRFRPAHLFCKALIDCIPYTMMKTKYWFVQTMQESSTWLHPSDTNESQKLFETTGLP